MGVIAGQPVTTNLEATNPQLIVNKNLYGTNDLTFDLSHFSKFGGLNATNTTTSSVW